MRQLELVHPGAPSPRDIVQPLTGFIQFEEFTNAEGIDLRQYIVGEKEHATFIYRAKGDEMNALGIFTDDILVADRSRSPKTGDIIVVRTQDGFAVRQVAVERSGRIHLFKQIIRDVDKVLCRQEAQECYGVVRRVIHSTV